MCLIHFNNVFFVFISHLGGLSDKRGVRFVAGKWAARNSKSPWVVKDGKFPEIRMAVEKEMKKENALLLDAKTMKNRYF